MYHRGRNLIESQARNERSLFIVELRMQTTDTLCITILRYLAIATNRGLRNKEKCPLVASLPWKIYLTRAAKTILYCDPIICQRLKAWAALATPAPPSCQKKLGSLRVA